jgi:hypothetical protein
MKSIYIDNRLSEEQQMNLKTLINTTVAGIYFERGEYHYYPDMFEYFSCIGNCLILFSEEGKKEYKQLFFRGSAIIDDLLFGNAHAIDIEEITISPEERDEAFKMRVAKGGQGQTIVEIKVYGRKRNRQLSQEEMEKYKLRIRDFSGESFYECFDTDLIVFEYRNGRRTFIQSEDRDELRINLGVTTEIHAYFKQMDRRGIKLQFSCGIA